MKNFSSSEIDWTRPENKNIKSKFYGMILKIIKEFRETWKEQKSY